MEEIYAFGANPLDRASERRGDADWVTALLDHPDSRIALLDELKPLVRPGPVPTIDWQTIAPWRALIEAGTTCALLGLTEGSARFALDVTGAPLAEMLGGERAGEFAEMRGLATVMAATDAAILGEARAVIDWHARHKFCAVCGTATRVASAGWCRRCPSCKAQHFPRTDPVVIMLPVRGERCLLGRNARRAGARFSCLAGFVEPGETLEEAVRREVLEESGLRTGAVRYVASQPWPFPSSLMCGFIAEAISDTLAIDTAELETARWFSRAEVLAMVARSAAGDGAPDSLAPPIAIGHHLARRWAAGEF
jgi:NAD+ diphosphatase